METTPRLLEEPIIEDYPVAYEALKEKLGEVVPFTAEYQDETGKQRISTAFIPGDGVSKETVVVNVPWSDSADIDLNLLRHVALAEHTGADVIIIGFPGYNKANNDTLTPKQKKDLRQEDAPSFGEVGKALASALEQVSSQPKVRGAMKDYWKNRSVTLSGYSQASMSELGMFLQMKEHVASKVTDLILWESPDALKSQPVKELIDNFMEDSKNGREAFQKNELVFGKDEARELGIHDKRFIGMAQFAIMAARKRTRLWVPLQAMAGSTTEKDIRALNDDGRLDGVRIQVINHGKSLVNPLDQAKELMKLLDKQVPRSGERVHSTREGAYHSDQNDIMGYTSTIKEVKK